MFVLHFVQRQYKRFQKRLSNIEWVYYLYGPYVYTYDNEIKRYPFDIERIEGVGNAEYEIINLDEDFARENMINEIDVLCFIRNLVREYGDEDLPELLDYIYFETEPMQNVSRRKEKLDFSSICREEKIISQSIPDNAAKLILDKYKGLLSNAKRL